LDIASKRVDWTVVTTDEVLAEFLTFFATAPEPMRRTLRGPTRVTA
jgi:hypothetical protein